MCVWVLLLNLMKSRETGQNSTWICVILIQEYVEHAKFGLISLDLCIWYCVHMGFAVESNEKVGEMAGIQHGLLLF